MLKLLFYLKLILIFITLNAGKSVKRGRLNDNALEDKGSWQNLWFPHPPNYGNDVEPQVNIETTATSSEETLTDNSKSSNWTGLWFPYPQNYQSGKTAGGSAGKQQHECDNGKDDLSIDFDPQGKRHSFNYLCLSNSSDYVPNLNTSALLTEYVIPSAYEPPVRCLNESIQYADPIPTFGAYRPLAPKFGTYKYVPPQRWIHSLADGAIILLYHPCAFPGQVEVLKSALKACLYRHIITPSLFLTPQHPMALLAWGKILRMSVVDGDTVNKFINTNAKMGFRQKQQYLKSSSKLYEAGLLAEAHLVTDEQDTEVCGYKEMR